MNNSKRFWRSLFFVFLITALCGGLALPIAQGVPVHAAPQERVSTNIVISEFRTRGPNGGNDEFIEIYNLNSSSVDISGWRITYSNSSGGGPDTLHTFSAGTVLEAGQYFLLANSGNYSGSTVPDATYTQSLANDGGIAILDSLNNVVDQVGMSSGSAYKEPADGSGILSPLTADNNQSYEREPGGGAGNCYDTDNNTSDFVLNASSSNPQNLDSTPLNCLGIVRVTGVSSTDGTYSAGATIDITVTFSGIVDVTGSPRLLLETGVTDTAAVYLSGTDTNTLTFRYTVAAGDTSTHLDYVSTNALTLNGGSIVGVAGNAILTLPSPGAAGSLGFNNSIVIDNSAGPTVISFVRQTPNVEVTNANSLTFRVTFSEAVSNVDGNDFVANGIVGPPAIVISVNPINTSVYDVTVSGGNLDGITGVVGLNLNPVHNITDTSGNALPITEPTVDETYTVDHTAPTITINQATGQLDPAAALPVNFTIVFSEPINVSTFTVGDITQGGTAGAVTWSISNPSGDQMNFTLSATSVGSSGTLVPSIAAGRVRDLAGNNNVASTSTDNSIDFGDTTRPSVTINQATGQLDPTGTPPVRFTVVFSEPIDTSVFVPSDIVQTGTATGITWSITEVSPPGNHTTFTLSATTITGAGTLIPTIPANRVRDLAGNNNTASTSTDNSVMFGIALPNVVISEFRTMGPRGDNDEFIELYNPTTNVVDIGNWKIYTSGASGAGSLRATIPVGTILRSGQHYLITNSASNGYSGNVAANLSYTGDIVNGGGIALFRADNSIADQVGMSAGTLYKEMPNLDPLTGNVNQSYERDLGGNDDNCQDTNNNRNDFSIPPINPSDPENYASTPIRLCGVVQTVATTTTTITADTPDPSIINATVSVSVKVSGGTTAFTGGRVNITGTNSNCTITLNSSGTGTCSVRFTSTGVKTITATYVGDNTHYGSTDTESHQVTTATPTKTRTPTPAPPPPLVAINEFVPRPGHDWNNDGVVNTNDEYVEIINHGVIDVNLSGYSLDDEVNIGSNPYRFPSLVLKPGDRVVFYGSETGLLLSDGGDGVRLLKPNGQLMDAYNYYVVRFPDQSYCRLPDNGGLDDWNQNCFPTPGLQNSLSGSAVNPPTSGEDEPLCPIADTLPNDFAYAECLPFGHNIWNSAYWDRFGWFDEKLLPDSPGKWPVFAE